MPHTLQERKLSITSRLVRATHDAVEGKLQVITQPYFCLKAVRQIVEHALSIKFYDTFLTAETTMRTGQHVGKAKSDPWAADMEASLKKQREAGEGNILVHVPKAGDLVFNHKIAQPYGHVGIMLSDGLVFENAGSPRGFSRTFVHKHPTKAGERVPGYLNVVPLELWFKPTLIVRLSESERLLGAKIIS